MRQQTIQPVVLLLTHHCLVLFEERSAEHYKQSSWSLELSAQSHGCTNVFNCLPDQGQYWKLSDIFNKEIWHRIDEWNSAPTTVIQHLHRGATWVGSIAAPRAPCIVRHWTWLLSQDCTSPQCRNSLLLLERGGPVSHGTCLSSANHHPCCNRHGDTLVESDFDNTKPSHRTCVVESLRWVVTKHDKEDQARFVLFWCCAKKQMLRLWSKVTLPKVPVLYNQISLSLSSTFWRTHQRGVISFCVIVTKTPCSVWLNKP